MRLRGVLAIDNLNTSREADHALSGALQEQKELRVSKLLSGLERSDRRKAALELAAQAVEVIVNEGIAVAMNRFNQKNKSNEEVEGT